MFPSADPDDYKSNGFSAKPLSIYSQVKGQGITSKMLSL
jgi:hypothetical protein